MANPRKLTSTSFKSKHSDSKSTQPLLASDSFSLLSNHLAQVKQKFELDRSTDESQNNNDAYTATSASLKQSKSRPAKSSSTNQPSTPHGDYDDEYNVTYTVSSTKPKRNKRKIIPKTANEIGQSNTGTDGRSQRDTNDTNDTHEDTDDAKLDRLDHFHRSSYLALKRKVEIYNKIKEGDEHDAKSLPASEVLLPDPDRLVEVEDEFGRTRLVKKSERHMYTQNKRPRQDSEDDSDGLEEDGSKRRNGVIYGNYIQSDMFKIDKDKADKIRRNEHDEEWENENATHYDPDWEKTRTRGTGFFKFETGDEAKRAQQMEELDSLRQETKDRVKVQDSPDSEYQKTKDYRMAYRDQVAERRAKIARLRKQQLDKMQQFVKSNDDL